MHHGRLAEAMKHVQLQIAMFGGELGNLVPENNTNMWKVVQDVFQVSPAQALVSEDLQEFSKEGEFHKLSIDSTVKIGLATIGQALQAHVRKRPNRNTQSGTEHLMVVAFH